MSLPRRRHTNPALLLSCRAARDRAWLIVVAVPLPVNRAARNRTLVVALAVAKLPKPRLQRQVLVAEQRVFAPGIWG